MVEGSIRSMTVLRVTGRPIHKRTFRRKTDAHHWAAKTKVDLREGHEVATAERQRLSVAELFDRYLAGPVAEWEREAAKGEVGGERLAKRAATHRRQLTGWRRRLGTSPV